MNYPKFVRSLVRFVTGSKFNVRFLSPWVMTNALILGLGSVVWGVDAALRPTIVQASTARLDVVLDRLPHETFNALIRRSELVARAAAQRSFDRDILTNEVAIVILARQKESQAPILLLKVSRSQWQSRPDIKQWATYYRTSERLLSQ
jgi:hypothetical protein